MVHVVLVTIPKDLAARVVRRVRVARKGPAGRAKAKAKAIEGARGVPLLVRGRRLLARNPRVTRNLNLHTAARTHVMSGPRMVRAAGVLSANSLTMHRLRHLLATRRRLRALRRAGRRRGRSDLSLELSLRRRGALAHLSMRAKPSRVPGNSLPRLPQLWSCLRALNRGARPTASVQRPRGGGKVSYPGTRQVSARPRFGTWVDALSRLHPGPFPLCIHLERL